MALTFANYILQPVFGHCVPDLALSVIAALLISKREYLSYPLLESFLYIIFDRITLLFFFNRFFDLR